jgi:hypothetical protein
MIGHIDIVCNQQAGVVIKYILKKKRIHQSHQKPPSYPFKVEPCFDLSQATAYGQLTVMDALPELK